MNRAKQSQGLDAAQVVKAYIRFSGSVSDEEALEGDEALEKAIEAFNDLYDKFDLVSGELIKAKQARPNSKSQSMNFDAMISSMSSIVRVQAWFRKILTLRRLEKQMREHKAASVAKKSYETPEEQALKEFSQQLVNKSLTPEGFYRLCDSDYKQTISAATFKEQIQKLGLKLSRGQLSRIIMILDEDMEGNITRQEYFDALEAYNVAGEKHKSFDGTIYHPFEHRALFKLISELKRKRIEYVEMFNACDVDDNRRLQIMELQKFVEGLSPDIKQKEIHALMSYLDIDKNGIVEKEEFLRQLNKGEQTYKQSQILNKQIIERKSQASTSKNRTNVDNFFEEEQIGAGDQAFAQDTINERQTISRGQDKPPVRPQAQIQPLDFEDQKRKILVEKMEREGQNFTQFFSNLKQLSSNGLIPLGSVLKALEVSYPTLPQNDRNFIVKNCMGQRGKIDYISLEQLFSKYSKNLKPSVAQTFSILAGNIILRMGGLQPYDSIRQFLRAQDVSENDQISEVEFQQLFSGKVQSINSRDLEQAFRSLDDDLDGFINVRDMIEVLLSYTDSQKTSINVKEMQSLIPGFESMSPRTRCEELIAFIVSELDKKNMKPINVFKMADTKNQGTVSGQILIQTFSKILPNIKSEVFQESFSAFKLRNIRDGVNRQDFETVFTVQSSYIPNSQSIAKQLQSSPQKQPASKATNQEEEEHLKWIRKLDNAMLRESVSPGVAFKAADLNHNGVVTVDELKQSFKRLIPEDTLPLVELKKIMMAFDQNRNGLIEENEFIGLIEKARNSNVTYMESPQKARQTNDQFLDSRGLPLKNASQKTQIDQNPIEIIVDNLDGKVNLKQLFAEIPINESGALGVAQIGRRFKTLETRDGQGLKPSEYLPVIKALDSKQDGLVQVRDLLKFMEKYSSQYESDCTLELKFMANFLEFQAKSRYTKSFLVNNSKLQADKRLMEIELMSELSKMFGISMQIGRIVFNQLQKLKGKGDVSLDDLCRLIDQYRIVPVDAQAEQKITQSQKLDSSKIMFKFVVKLMSFPPRKRNTINASILEIEKREKSIPYRDFFELFVTELGIIDIPESKALFEYFRSLSNKNSILVDVFQLQIQKVQDQIFDAQEKALGNTIVSDQIIEGLTKVRMNEQGYLSKTHLKEYLIFNGVLNKKGTSPQDSDYCRHLRNLLMQEDLEISAQLQPDEFYEGLLVNENENLKFWTAVEFLSKASERYQPFQSIIFKFLGKVIDLMAPGKATTQALSTVNSQLQIIDGLALIQTIEGCQDVLIKKNIGFNQGALKEHSKECIEYIFTKLGNKPQRINQEEHPLIQQINRNRAFLPKGSDNNLESSSQLESASNTELVRRIEQQIGQKLEDVVKPIFDQDQLATLQFQRLVISSSQKVDKALTSQLCLAIDFKKTRMISVKDFITFIKAVDGKYQQDKVLSQIAQEIEEPVQRSLENQGITASDSYQKNEFVDCISQVSNVSQFHSLCLFYSLVREDEDQLSGKVIIQKIREAKDELSQKKGVQPKSQLDDSREEKKSVRFQVDQTPRDSEKAKQLANLFVSSFAQLSQLEVIESALRKFNEFLKPVKLLADALAKFDKSGKGFLGVEQFRSKLDQIPQLTDNEKLVLSFIPINKDKTDPFLINVQEFIKVVKLQNLQKADINQNLVILKANYESVRSLLGLNKEEGKKQSKKLHQDLDQMKKQHDREVEENIPTLFAVLKGLSKDPKKLQQFLDLFEKAPNQKVSYRKFHDFFAKTLKVNAPESEYDELMEHIDIDEIGKLTLIDMMNFCQKHNIPITSKLAKEKSQRVDEREAKGERLRCEMLEYVIVPERDFYIKGLSTILNSEKAAIVMAEKLFNSIGEDDEFFDQEFGPKNAEDADGSRFSMYCNGEPPKGYIDPEGIDWVIPEEITEETPMFFDDGPAPNDVIQGKLGDCWFIGALSVLATRDDLLRGGVGYIQIGPDFQVTPEIAEKFSMGVYPPIFHYYRQRGVYVFRFFKEFNWRYVIIDDRIPVFSYNKKPLFASCKQLHELWVPLLEKAYAKIHGCYETLISGFIDDALSDLTGLVAEKLQLHNENKIFPHRQIKDKEVFWKYLLGLSQSEEKSMLGCSVVGDTEREIMIDGQKTGIMTGHAYGIIDVFEIKSDVKVHRLLRIRNPWGNMEWKGKWSDRSEEMEKYADVLQEQYISRLEEEERFTPGEDGTFLMNYQSWRDIFNNMYICIDFPKTWNAIRFRSQWDATCSGGVPSPMTPENMKKWAQNPQYLFDSDEDFEVFISLAQIDGRAKRPDGRYLKFPYSEVIHPMLFTVCELPAGKNRLEAFDKNLVKGASVLKQHKEVSLRLSLPRGRYVIVPATRSQGQYGEYTLSIYFSVDDDVVEVTRIDKPDDEFTLIAEETERYDNAEDWKIDLCEKRIKYMVAQKDMIDDPMNNSTSFSQSPMKLSVAMEKGGKKKSVRSPNRSPNRSPSRSPNGSPNFDAEDAFPDDEVIE